MKFPKTFDNYIEAREVARSASRRTLDSAKGAFSVYEYLEQEGLYIVHASFWGPPHHCEEILKYQDGFCT